MADKTAPLKIEVTANTTDAEKGLDKVAVAAKEASKEIKKAGDESSNASDNIDKLGKNSANTAKNVKVVGDNLKNTSNNAKEFTNAIKKAGESTSHFSEKGASLISSLGKFKALGATALIAYEIGKTTVKITGNIIEAGKESINLKKTFEDLGGSYTTLNKVSDSLRGTVRQTDLLRIANQGLIAQLPNFNTNFENIAIQSKKVASSLGISVPAAMEKLIHTITTGNVAQLNQYGITLKIKEAEENYAYSIGKTRSELTSKEKQIAKVSTSLEKLSEVVNNQGLPLKNVGDAWDELFTTINNVFHDISEGITKNEGLRKSLNGISEAIKNIDFAFLGNALGHILNLVSSIWEYLAKIVSFPISKFINGLKYITNEFKEWETSVKEQREIVIRSKKFGNIFDRITSFIRNENGPIERAKAEIEEEKQLKQFESRKEFLPKFVEDFNKLKKDFENIKLFSESELESFKSKLNKLDKDAEEHYVFKFFGSTPFENKAKFLAYRKEVENLRKSRRDFYTKLNSTETISDALKRDYNNFINATNTLEKKYENDINEHSKNLLTQSTARKHLKLIEEQLGKKNELQNKFQNNTEIDKSISELEKLQQSYEDLLPTLPRTAGGLAGVSREEREAQRKSEQLRKEIERMHNQWDSYIDSWESNSLSQQLEEALKSNNIEEFEKIREVQLQKKLAEFENTYQEYVEKGIITQIEFENQRHEIKKEHDKETAKMEEENAQHLVEIYANAFDNISNIIGKTLDNVFGNYNFSNLFDTFNSQLSNSTKDSFLNPIAEFFGADTSTKEGRESFAASMNSIFSTFSSSVSQIMSANSTKEENQAIGGAIGAGIGTAIGTVLGGGLPGAALGAAIGNTAGNIIGSKINSGNNKDKESRKAFQWALEDLINENKTFMLKDLQSGKWESFLAAGKADFEIISTEAFNEYLKKSQSGFNKITHAVVNHFEQAALPTKLYNASWAGQDVGITVDAAHKEYNGNRLDWSAAYWEQVSNVANDAFLGIGNAYVGLIEDCEEIGSQFAAMLAHNLGNSVDNIRAFVYETGMSLEDMQESLMNLALKGDITWHEWAVSMQGLETAFGEGLEAEGDLAGAWDQFIASAGRGKAALLGLKNIAIEAGEAGITSIAGLGDYLKNLGISAESVDGLLSALAQSGIQTIEELKNAEDGVLGQIIAGTQSMSNDVASIWSELNNQINDVQDALNNIPEQVHSDVVINVQTAMDAAAREDLKLLKTVTSDGTITIPDNSETTATIGHAAGGVFTRPTIIGGHLFGEAGDELLMPLDRYLSSLDIQDRTPKTIINIDARGASEGVEQNLRVIFEEMGDLIIQNAVEAAVNTVGGY